MPLLPRSFASVTNDSLGICAKIGVSPCDNSATDTSMDFVKYAPWLVPLILTAMIAATVAYHPHQPVKWPAPATDKPATSR